jgi:hypothetical protein
VRICCDYRVQLVRLKESRCLAQLRWFLKRESDEQLMRSREAWNGAETSILDQKDSLDSLLLVEYLINSISAPECLSKV